MGPNSASPLYRSPSANNITIMADHPLYRDPWAKREAWRKHPIFSRSYYFRNMFPGFGIAVVAFTAYVAFDNIRHAGSSKKEEHH